MGMIHRIQPDKRDVATFTCIFYLVLEFSINSHCQFGDLKQIQSSPPSQIQMQSIFPCQSSKWLRAIFLTSDRRSEASLVLCTQQAFCYGLRSLPLHSVSHHSFSLYPCFLSLHYILSARSRLLDLLDLQYKFIILSK
jgi:hypothetical protein